MDWRHETVLVTGAGGFIGSHLAERLVQLGATTRAFIRYNSSGSLGWLDLSPDKQQIRPIFGDIRDLSTLQSAMRGATTVFHLAALIAIPYSYNATLSYARTNIEGTLNVLESARAAGVERIINTSTSEVYGSAIYVPIDEQHPLQAQSPYAATKVAADKLSESFYLSFDLPVATIRPFNTYGPRQSTRAIIPTIITQSLTQAQIRLGNLEARRDFNFVADTVEGFIMVAEESRTAGQVVNVGAGADISVRHLAEKILQIMDKNLPIMSDKERTRPEKSEVDRLCASNAKAKSLIGWQPAHTLETGLEKTIEWFASNLGQYQADVYGV